MFTEAQVSAAEGIGDGLNSSGSNRKVHQAERLVAAKRFSARPVAHLFDEIGLF
jgi:hypothetical protein